MVFEKTEDVDGEIYIDVSSAVINPEVYPLPIESRIKDAVITAGGLDVDADRTYIFQNANMARVLKDGEKIPQMISVIVITL